MIVAGIMTGTSVDAIDVAICEIQEQGDRHSIALLSFSSHDYPEDVRELVHGIMRQPSLAADISALPFMLARSCAQAITSAQSLISSKNADAKIEAIGVHGQTMWHDPPHSTWQAMSGPTLAELTSTKVVYDFRSADVALGGQGAPLVPIFDLATLADSNTDRVALNIGGMANITLLPKQRAHAGITDANTQLVAFDTGPGNVLIDAAAQQFFGKRFDKNGTIAREGVVIPPMLESMRLLPYFASPPPKSTGRELFNDEFVSAIAERFRASLRPHEDILTTMTELTAWSIADHISRFQPSTTEIIASGGGTNNMYLMERLRLHVGNINVRVSDELDIPSQAKEAMAFAYIAWRTLHGLPSAMPSVTGASRATICGAVCSPTRNLRL